MTVLVMRIVRTFERWNVRTFGRRSRRFGTLERWNVRTFGRRSRRFGTVGTFERWNVGTFVRIVGTLEGWNAGTFVVRQRLEISHEKANLTTAFFSLVLQI